MDELSTVLNQVGMGSSRAVLLPLKKTDPEEGGKDND